MFGGFLFSTGKLCYIWQSLICQMTFGSHQGQINRPVLEGLETVWDRAVSRHSALCCVEVIWSQTFPLGECNSPWRPHSVLFMPTVRTSVDLAEASKLPTSALPQPCSFTHLTFDLTLGVWSGLAWGLEQQSRRQWCCCFGFREPIKTQDSVLLWED